MAIVEMFDQMSKAAETGDDSQLRNSLDRFKSIHQQIGDLYSGLVVAEREQAQVQREALREAFEHSTSWRITAPLRWAKTTSARFAGFAPFTGFLDNLSAPLRQNPGRHARGRIATSMPVDAGKQQQGTC